MSNVSKKEQDSLMKLDAELNKIPYNEISKEIYEMALDLIKNQNEKLLHMDVNFGKYGEFFNNNEGIFPIIFDIKKWHWENFGSKKSINPKCSSCAGTGKVPLFDGKFFNCPCD